MTDARQRRAWVRRLHRVLRGYRFRVVSASRDTIARQSGSAWEDVGLSRGRVLMIAHDLPALAWKDTLLHEAGHMVQAADRPGAGDRAPHGAGWGRAFARVYRSFYGTA